MAMGGQDGAKLLSALDGDEHVGAEAVDLIGFEHLADAGYQTAGVDDRHGRFGLV
ncbi:hypothetical protein JCM13664_09090 [Methylothermus subterraneus]